MVGEVQVVRAPRAGAVLLVWFPAALGVLSVVVVMIASIRLYVVPAVHAPAWFGVDLARSAPRHAGAWGAGLGAAGVALLGSWAWLARRAVHVGQRRLVLVACSWAVPLLIGPPMLSLDVYSYAAVGRLSAAGQDPYSVGPSALGRGSFLEAVDPLWRHTPTPYGPLLVALLTGVAVLGHGSVLATAALLRAVAVLVTAAAMLLAVQVARPSRRVRVLVLCALNPLVLVTLVSGGHLDALVGAAAIGVVVLTVDGRPHPAMVVAVGAGLVKAPAFLLVAFVLLYAVRRPGARRPATVGLGLVATAAGVLALSWLLLPDAFGWTGALGVPGIARGFQAPSEWLGWGMREVSVLFGAGLSTVLARAIGRVTMLAVGAALMGFLLWRATARSDREWALRHVGGALVVCALTAPVLYGWYAAWGLFPLAAAAGRRERTAVALLSAGLLAAALLM